MRLGCAQRLSFARTIELQLATVQCTKAERKADRKAAKALELKAALREEE